MFSALTDLWNWLNGITTPTTPTEPTTIGNYNTLPETNSPQHTHLSRTITFNNKV